MLTACSWLLQDKHGHYGQQSPVSQKNHPKPQTLKGLGGVDGLLIEEVGFVNLEVWGGFGWQGFRLGFRVCSGLRFGT